MKPKNCIFNFSGVRLYELYRHRFYGDLVQVNKSLFIADIQLRKKEPIINIRLQQFSEHILVQH